MPDSSRTSRPARSRSVVLGVIGFYVLLFVAVIWPVYPLFATIEPRVLGMPFSLTYVVVALLLSFFVLFGFYRWEERRGRNEPIGASDAGAREGPGGAVDELAGEDG
jgi:hypothetical protein